MGGGLGQNDDHFLKFRMLKSDIDTATFSYINELKLQMSEAT